MEDATVRSCFDTIEISGWEGAFRGMRNPLNSWAKKDSSYKSESSWSNNVWYHEYIIGENDMKLAKTLISSGPEHAKFLRMLHVQVNVDMPRYWWSEADTYHFGTKDSCSTMHKLLNNASPITIDMFLICEEDRDVFEVVIGRLEELRQKYKDVQKNYTGEDKQKILNHLVVRAKRLLPEGYYQMRTWDTNYAELRNMYHQRKHHRLEEEWQDKFCRWVESLPYAKEFIIGEE